MNQLTKVVLNFISVSFIIAAIAFSASASASADESKVYLVGKQAPLGASSQTGKGANGIYLRWDIVEGQFPSDVVALRLKKDGVMLLERGVSEVMTATDIRSLYAPRSERQRLLQTITLLKKYVLGQPENPAMTDFSVENFAEKLQSLLNSSADNAWALLASRINFNIARSRYRAFLDLNASGTPTYTLLAVNISGQEALLGKVTVDTSKNSQLMPVTNFIQIADQSCSSVDRMKDHATVVLDWDAAGNGEPDRSITDLTANGFQLSGYYLYRTSSNLADGIDVAPPVDIAALAATAAHDQRGNVVSLISNGFQLERVNDEILMTEGKESALQSQSASQLNDTDYAYFESPKELTAAGLKPGDKRAYYIVPIDFAGHMGPTKATIVRVPNKTPPASPWNIQFRQLNPSQPIAVLQWDESTLVNYSEFYNQSRVICSDNNGLVAYAKNQEACASPNYTRIDADQYLVYRFNSSEQAIGFVDADGDGVADIDERASGSQCDSQTIAAGENFLVQSEGFTRVTLSGGRTKMQFADEFLTQDNNLAKVYWYRLASKTNDGQVSFLTGPIRAAFYDMIAPGKPSFTAEVEGNCCKVELVDESQKDWKFVDEVGLYDNLSLEYSNTATAASSAVLVSDFGDNASAVCSSDSSPISDFWGYSNNRILNYPAGTRGSLSPAYCRVSLPGTMNLCSGGSWRLVEKNCRVPLIDGDSVDPHKTIVITVNAPDANSCVSVWDEINGQETRVGTSCGTGSPGSVQLQLPPGFCGYTTAQDASGNISARTQLPCSVPAAVVAPNPPQIISFSANSQSVDFSWRLPLSPVAMTQIEITSDQFPVVDSTDNLVFSVANAGFEPGRIFEGQSKIIHALVDERDQWCIRMKSIAPTAENDTALTSPWSNKICKVRRASGIVSTNYLPWPKLPALQVANNLTVRLASDFVDPVNGMLYEKMPLLIDFGERDISQCIFRDYPENVTEEEPRSLIFARALYCTSQRDFLTVSRLSDVPLMVYRQAETANGNRGDWIQVTPLIESIFWRRFIDKDVSGWLLEDPYFKLFRTSIQDNNWRLALVDRYAYTAGYKYRYQIISFSENHAIKQVRQSDWVTTESLVLENGGTK